MTRRKLELYLDGKLPSGNVFDRGGANWRTRWVRNKKLIEDWHWLVKQAIQKAKIEQDGFYFTDKVKCSVARIYSGRAKYFDEANLTHSLDKLVIDNLVKERIITDDSPEFFSWGGVEQYRGTGKDDRIILMLEEEG